MRALAVTAAFLTFACRAWCEPANLVANGGFEGAFAPNGVAETWLDDSYTNWGTKDIVFARDTENPHSGAASQRITCRRIGYIGPDRISWIAYGGVQLRAAAPVPLKKGMVYHVRAWLRADDVMEAHVRLRQAGSPWWPYADKTIVLGKAWQEVEYYWSSSLDDPTTAFMVYYATLGSVWVDDVSVEELSAEAARMTVPPPVTGNLLPNGNFDLGLANWLGSIGWESLRDPEFVIEPGDHGACLKVPVPDGRTVGVVSDVVPLTPGYPLRVSCRLRAASPVKVNLGAWWQGAQHAQWAYCSTEAQVGTDWRTVQAAGEVGFLPDKPYAFLRVLFTGPTTLWVDDAEVRQDGEKAPDVLARASMHSDRHPFGLYNEPDKPTLRLLSSRPNGLAGKDARAAELTWTVEDYWGKPALSGRWTPPPGAQEKRISGTGLSRGWYRATVTWTADGRPCRNESTFCVLPPAARTDDPATSPFGAHFQYDPAHINLAHAVGARWMRLWPPTLTCWNTVEPKQGEWQWNDAAISALARGGGFRLYGMLENPPEWAGGGTPEFWAGWENYVRTVVAHYQADIHVWEVRNEPDLAWWTSKPTGPNRAEVYFEYLKRSYPIIKQADPTATVVGGCVAGDFRAKADGLQFAQELFQLGALQYMDVLSYHYYHAVTLPLPIDEGPEPIADQIARLRERMRAAGKVVPIINSEGGVYNPASALTYRPCAPDNVSPFPGQEVARLLVRLYVAQWAAGVDRFLYYDFFMGGSPYAKAWDSFAEGDGQPRPDIAAYATMTWLLEGAKYERTDRPTPDQFQYRFATPRGPLVVAYTRTGTKSDMAFPGAVRAWDIMGKEIGLGAGRRLRVTDVPTYVLLRR